MPAGTGISFAPSAQKKRGKAMEHHKLDCICDQCLQEAQTRNEREGEAQAVADVVTRYLNHSNPSDLAKAIGRDHRTLQQLFTRVCVEWINNLSKLESGGYDLRNADSVELAKSLVETDAWKKSCLRYI
jgi:hypothetical protein